jgi:NADH-quinone oxidoreductase subunit E
MGDLLIETSREEAFSREGFRGSPDELIPLLQHYQKKNGYLSAEGLRQIAIFLHISEAQIYGVASFYTQFRFEKPGENQIRVCQGTACHVQGGQQISDEVRKQLGVSAGHTTPDGKFEFEEVACLGCCAQAAVVEINGKIHARMTPEKVREVLNDDQQL